MSKGNLRRNLVRTTALVGSLCFTLLTGEALAQPQTYNFDMPAQSLSASLREYARVSGQQIIFTNDLVAGLTAPALHGDFNADGALSKLLAGSDLVVERTPSGAIMVRKKNEQAAMNEGASSSSEVETVVVTGTHIRGIAEPTSIVTSIDRTAIERSGFSTTQQLIRSLPQNFAGGAYGATEDGILGSGNRVGTNNEAASGVNLRGLGNGSTLVLLDGHRMAPSDYGGVVDVSVIPLLAIDRVDVLTDGASAIYGADAVGGVVNFVLRKDFDGAQTDVTAGTVTSGKLSEYTVSQVVGKDWQSGNAMLLFQYHDRGELSTADRKFTASAPRPTDIIPALLQYTGMFSGHQNIAPGLEVSADALVSRQNLAQVHTNSATNYNAAAVDSDQMNYNVDVGYRPFGDWRFDLAGTYSSEHMSFAWTRAEPIPGGYTLGTPAVRNDDSLASIELNGDGTLFSLPAGNVKAAIGGSFRAEDFSSVVTYFPTTSPVYRRQEHRHVTAVYGELYIPIFGDSANIPFVRRLDISAAVRYDRYSDFGGTTNPKLGLLWSPVTDLTIRGSWGTSYRAPDASDLLNQALGVTIINYQVASPDGTGTSNVFILGGVNSNLLPETSHNWTLGAEYKPTFLPGLDLSASYYNIRYRNRILQPPFTADILERPSVYGSLVTPLADDTAAANFLAEQVAKGATFYDIFGFGSTDVRYVYNDREQNAAILNQSGIDLAADYPFELWGSNFDTQLAASVVNEIDTAFTQTSALTDFANTYGNPLHLRMRGMMSWSRGSWNVNGAVNFSNSYKDTSVLPTGTVPSLTTVDLNVRYAPRETTSAILHGASIGVRVINLFDQNPPYVGGLGFPGVHYDVGNASPLGRFLSIELRKTW